ncbi:MAG: hypothetical protein IJ680_08650 [Paludibacteraceae bacterium]|nr:hypothetical protein [Paludibacteraceae bacterium]
MRKYDFLVYHKQYADFLEQLRKVGVLHVTEKPDALAESEQLREQMQLKARIDKAIAEVSALLPEGTQTWPADEQPDFKLLDQLNQLTAERSQLEQTIQQTQSELQRMQVWGAFDTKRIGQIQDAGYQVQFFCCPENRFDASWIDDFNALQVGKEGQNVYFVTINHEHVHPEADAVQLNDHNIIQLQTDIDNLNGLLVAQQAKLEAWSIANLGNLKALRVRVETDIDWQRVQLSTEHADEGAVRVLEGYCPQEQEDELVKMLEAQGIYYEAADPDFEDPNIPIKLKNNFFAKLFEPITRLYSLPNYSELDLTAMFAPFFMLFFGLCMGDAGYGLLILAAAIFVRLKMPDLKNWANLGIFLGAATVFAGLLTGTFFGISPTSDYAPNFWPERLRGLFLTSDNYADTLGFDPMMILAIALGIIQILFAMLLKGIKITNQHGFRYAASTFAWLVLLIDLIVLAAGMMGMQMGQGVQYVLYCIAIAMGLVILFYNAPGKNPLINLGSGLYGTYNMASGLLGDVLSYIRLFALGLAGGILGNVFNQLALQLGGAMPSWIGWLPCILVMLFGHGLNLFLCVISAVVHPMRLTFVEFYKNAEFEGRGLAYRPFSAAADKD